MKEEFSRPATTRRHLIWSPSGSRKDDNIRVADAFVVDLMLNANGQTFDSLRPCALTIELSGMPVKTVNLEGLLLTKQTMSDKDVGDRSIIERALEHFRSRAKPDDGGGH